MDKNNKEKLLKQIDELRIDDIHPSKAELLLLPILNVLLENEGFDVYHTGGVGDKGIDFRANKDNYIIGIQHKHYTNKSREVSVSVIREMLGTALLESLNKVIIISNTPFSKEARNVMSKQLPIELELIDIDALKAWGARLCVSDSLQDQARTIISNFSRDLALLIAKDSLILEVIEWRDLERIIAEIFYKMGFKVELTPPSKDGGRDIILECKIFNEKNTFIVEIKHWRSGQRVGASMIKDFLKVILKEKREGGIFLSTYGYCDNAFEQLTEIDRQILKFGDKSKIISLCNIYTKIQSGIWMPDLKLPELLFEETK